LGRDPMSVALDELRSGQADQIGHFPLRPLHLLIPLVPKRKHVQRAGSSAEMTLRNMQVDGSVCQIAMPQKKLNGAEVGPVFE
jgi:hypothetical protein